MDRIDVYLSPSTRADKKWMVKLEGKTVHFGAVARITTNISLRIYLGLKLKPRKISKVANLFIK